MQRVSSLRYPKYTAPFFKLIKIRFLDNASSSICATVHVLFHSTKKVYNKSYAKNLFSLDIKLKYEIGYFERPLQTQEEHIM